MSIASFSPPSEPSSKLPSVGIRALKQNASEVVARVTAGENIEITDRGRPVAQIVPIRQDRIRQLVDSGQLFMPSRTFSDYLEERNQRNQQHAKQASNKDRFANESGMTTQEIIDELRAERLL